MNFAEGGVSGHLDHGLLIRYLDEELEPGELLGVEKHLAACESCRRECGEIRKASMGLDDLVLSAPITFAQTERERLLQTMSQRERDLATASKGRRQWWPMAGAAAALAASLWLGTMLVRSSRQVSEPASAVASSQAVATTFEVDGEKFWALPYSNPDLPMPTARVVQMEVPVSSLADAGIVVEPVVSRVATPDRAVLADVVLGLDGQPLGVHVVDVD